MFSINKFVKRCTYPRNGIDNKCLPYIAEIFLVDVSWYTTSFFTGLFTLMCMQLPLGALAAHHAVNQHPDNNVCNQFFNQYQKYEKSLDEITSCATVDLPIDSTSKLTGLDEFRNQTNLQDDRNLMVSNLRKHRTADHPPLLPGGANSFTPINATVINVTADIGRYREPQSHQYNRTTAEKQLEEVNYLKLKGCFDSQVLDARMEEGDEINQRWMIVFKNGDVSECFGAPSTANCSVVAHIKHSTIELASIAPSGSKVGFAGGGEFGLFDIETAETFTDDHVGGKFKALAWSSPQDGQIRQGEQLLVASADGDIFLYNPRAADPRKRIEKYSGHSSVPSALAFLPDGTVFISADWQGVVAATQLYDEETMSDIEYQKDYMRGRVFQMKATRKVAKRKSSESISSIMMIPGDDLFVLGGVNGTVELWEIKGFAQADSKKQSTAEIVSIRVSQDGTTVATLNRKGGVDLWNVKPGEVVMGIEGKKRLVYKRSLPRSGYSFLLSVSSSGNVLGLDSAGCLIK